MLMGGLTAQIRIVQGLKVLRARVTKPKFKPYLSLRPSFSMLPKGSFELAMAKKSKRDHQKPEAEETKQTQKKLCEDEQDEQEKSFEELGLDPRLLRALLKKGIEKPFPIQSVAIPLVLQGKDVVAQARTGTGKTLAYLLPLLHKLFTSDIGPRTRAAPAAFILVPTRELCQQVHKEASSLIELCRVQLKVVQLNSSMPNPDLRTALAGCPDVLVTTPKCLRDCLSSGFLQSTAVNESLEFLVLDEADLLLQFRFEDDLKTLTAVIPKRCQCLLMSATTSSDVDQLKKMLLQNPIILTLSEVEDVKKEIISKNVHQYWISCNPGDKLLYILALLKLDRVVEKKVLIFTNSIDMGFRLKLFLEKFGIKSAILNAELPQNSRLHILEGFNAGLYDYLIATDVSQRKEKEESSENNRASRKSKKHAKPKLDSEFGVVRGIDFKRVETIINFDMPSSVEGYVHRIGRTGRAYRGGSAISLVSPDEMEVFGEINSFLGDNGAPDVIKEFPSSIKNAAESLRYRSEDVAKSVTKIAVREARAQDLRNEILNSEKLKAHFEANPKDLDLLKHDKILSKKLPAPHLRDLPSYLIDRKTQEASKIIRLTEDALQQKKTDQRQQRSKKKFKRSRDPLKTFSAGVSKKGGTKREMKGGDDTNNPKRNRS